MVILSCSDGVFDVGVLGTASPSFQPAIVANVWGSLVTVQATSTLWVGSDGSPVSGPSSSKSNTIALGVGLGVGIPAALAVASLAIWSCIWKRRRNRRREFSQNAALPPVMGEQSDEHYRTPGPFTPLPPAVSSISRKPVGTPQSQMKELPGQGVKRELGGQELHPFPIISPSSPVTVPGQHGMMGEGEMHELPGQTSYRG